MRKPAGLRRGPHLVIKSYRVVKTKTKTKTKTKEVIFAKEDPLAKAI